MEKEVRRFKVKRVEFKDLFINFRAFGGYNAKFSSVIGFKDSLRRSGGDASFNLFIPGKYRGCRWGNKEDAGVDLVEREEYKGGFDSFVLGFILGFWYFGCRESGLEYSSFIPGGKSDRENKFGGDDFICFELGFLFEVVDGGKVEVFERSGVPFWPESVCHNLEFV